MLVVAKIEKDSALENIESIVRASDAVMVARGDLGLELPLERVPRAQKEITRRARLAGKPVIVATQVLESMMTEARPTRAEVNDAANAVEDGVDVIMLAGETAAGAHPVRAVKTLNAIIGDAETAPLHSVAAVERTAVHDHARALCEAAVTLADRSAAQAIVAVTRGGTTARSLSALRPQAPIIAATEREDTARRLTLYWGVVPLCIRIGENLDEASMRISAELIDRGFIAAGATCVFVSISADTTRRDANYLRIHQV
jgi:pyruvate kinase